MATSELSHADALLRERPVARGVTSPRHVVVRALSVLASLRLTVVLFAAAIFLVFVGTLAQKDQDVWRVVNDTYFRVWFAQVDLLTFERLVQIFFKNVDWQLTGGFLFPGGKTIGLLLLVNLFAAHAVRFKVAAAGMRLAIGLAVIAVGALLTWQVIRTGMGEAVVSELSPAFYNTLWNALRASVAALAFAGGYVLWVGLGDRRSPVWWMLAVVDLLVAALAVWLLANSQFRLDDASLRILWQLIQGTAAGAVLLVGCVLVFRQRAGIVLLHSGIALLMISELWTAVTANESQMAISEGGSANYSSDTRTAELAVVMGEHAGHDHVTVVPRSLLIDNVGASEPIRHDDLPFDIRVHRWLANSKIAALPKDATNPATTGFGLRETAVDVPPATGVGEDAAKVDIPSAYVELFSKETSNSLGTYLVSQWLEPQPIDIDGQKYDLALRFKRINHPFTLALKDFDFKRYTGTNTAKNFSSLVRLQDPERNVDRDVLIWMNNPLRYAGNTLYQSSFDDKTEKTTFLQVVTNPGWMTPYVACMLVTVGMLAHFSVMLVRFLRRRADEQSIVLPASPLQRAGAYGSSATILNNPWSLRAVWFPALVVAVFAVYVASKARVPRSPAGEMQISEFAKLPVAYKGRVKPYDTLARNALQILSGKQEVILVDDNLEVTQRLPAIRWLIDSIAGVDAADEYPVFRIENLDLLNTLGLKPRPQNFRYSLKEIESKPGELDRQIALLKDVPEEELSLDQRKVLSLSNKRDLYRALTWSFRSPPISMGTREELAASLQTTQEIIFRLRGSQAPCAVPPNEVSTDWTTLMEAQFNAIRDRVMNQPGNPATAALTSLLAAYARGDSTKFNRELADFRKILANYDQSVTANRQKLLAEGAHNAEILSQKKISFEVFYNQFTPFYFAAVLYFFAFVLGVLSWIGWTQPLRRASIGLLWFTFALHTFALVARIYISGRPPVTNLYSTAIFIGWGGVLMALMFESTYRIGLGNIVAAVIGFLTLILAYNLSLDGDTFIVLQAVLDTQFWLATHVVTINLGYAATYMAGLWGAVYILLVHVFQVLDADSRQKVLRSLYGTLCFAIFFSFVGTVLGGLWADDSWGRFWGWDPKENGALIIVLWNALVLHARWGGLVKGRGLATLAVGGNIVTTWSYFGVNELGVGLHSYGASETSTAMWLLIFASSQLALMALGAMPADWFPKKGTGPISASTA